jgi:RsmE family RNA methyltransferase
MNLLLLHDDDFLSEARVQVQGRRLRHVLEVHRAAVGASLRVGRIGGAIGNGTVVALDAQRLELAVTLDQPPPAPLPISLLLALPRPKMLKRVLQAATSLGVKQIYLLNSYRVEKSYWSSPLLQPAQLQEQLLLGLEQARDTLLPQIHLRPRFKPFVEDELPQLAAATAAFVAQPAATPNWPLAAAGPATLAVGPEGGFIPYELEKLQEAGFARISLGERILRVETAVPVLLTRLSPG